ncbi:MAG: hypothetical protein OES12_10860 [Anaerolineae bacterium]|nr:hypothetical protein [Anaerolineae bacterium]
MSSYCQFAPGLCRVGAETTLTGALVMREDGFPLLMGRIKWSGN